MGMPVTVEVVGADVTTARGIEEVFQLFTAVDERFSTYKEGSEISRINRGEITPNNWSALMQEVMALCERTKEETNSYFDIRRPDSLLDPSGVVKGWAIGGAADLLIQNGFKDFFIDAGGDVQTHGRNSEGEEWSIGIRNPFKQDEIVKVLYPHGAGVATSGSYVRGAHIYNPHDPAAPLNELVSLTVIGPTICEADRFATAAFAMGMEGVHFIERLAGFEAYAIDKDGLATLTSHLELYTQP
jgi:thiamine biosynthesis lipoprotein